MSLYPTPADHRMAYDRDGTVCAVSFNGNPPVQFSASSQNALNSEATNPVADNGSIASTSNGTYYFIWVFPDLRDIVQMFTVYGFGSQSGFQTSVNTTTGLDGTWVSQTQPPSDSIGHYRSNLVNVSFSGIKGIRYQQFQNGAAGMENVHLYGRPSSGQNPDSLRIWQPVTNAELVSVVDEGDIARGASQTNQFRVHNQSATKTAHGITVSFDTPLDDASPSLLSQISLSTDNVTFSSSISLSDLAPGATSPICYVRDQIATSAALSVWALRFVAAATSFS